MLNLNFILIFLIVFVSNFNQAQVNFPPLSKDSLHTTYPYATILLSNKKGVITNEKKGDFSLWY